jgi:hypothetical protein
MGNSIRTVPLLLLLVTGSAAARARVAEARLALRRLSKAGEAGRRKAPRRLCTEVPGCGIPGSPSC